MATTTIPYDQQQQQQQQQGGEEAVPIPGAVSNNGWHSSGSIGPFFAVISVLTVLAILSCILGRICRGRRLSSPLESFKDRGCCCFGFGWLKKKCCLGCVEGQVLGNKGLDGHKENNDGNKVQDSAV